ncbi:DUF421 domain-containing protein [Virgibacillus xinjiangensis]|uniref:DUF421 domain-containing protein n=1 Tax=Virgibacillus xinjiangensis TaxID=393090 RepID=A0ABV7CR19_9BACI
MDIVSLTTEILVGFFLLFVIIKFAGKKIINQVTPFTFIAAIVLSELLGNALYEETVGLFYIMYAMGLWGGLLVFVEYMGQKFLWFRGVSEGKPSALIERGMVSREALRKNGMNLNQLQSLLRQSEIFSVREVAFCYLEANGAISVLKKSKYQKTVQDDFHMPIQQVEVPITFIRDGKILWDELEEAGFDEAWLQTQLTKQGINRRKNVFLAEWLEGDGLFVQTYE